MYKAIIYFLLLLLAFDSQKANGQLSSAKGSLFIIGGGSISDSLRSELLRTAGWKKGDIIVAVTLASGLGEEAYQGTNAAFKKLTGEDCVKFDSAAVRNALKQDSLRRARIIYLGGGAQDRFMSLITGSPVAAIIREVYQKGSVIGGTSAGAAVMSRLMITGNGLRDTIYASTFKVLQKGNLEIQEGLGLLDSVIIDQHFVVRSRFNRMLSALMEYPSHQCIGIDESTAIIIHQGIARVVGASQVLVFSDPVNIHTGKSEAFAVSDLRIAIYVEGEQFRVRR